MNIVRMNSAEIATLKATDWSPSNKNDLETAIWQMFTVFFNDPIAITLTAQSLTLVGIDKIFTPEETAELIQRPCSIQADAFIDGLPPAYAISVLRVLLARLNKSNNDHENFHIGSSYLAGR